MLCCSFTVCWFALSLMHQQGLSVLAPGLLTTLLSFLSLVSVALQGSEVVDQVLHTVSKSNSLEELTLENAGLKSYVSLRVSPDRRLLLFNLIWPSPFLLLTLSPVRPPPPFTLSLLPHHLFYLISPFRRRSAAVPRAAFLTFPSLYTLSSLWFIYSVIIRSLLLFASGRFAIYLLKELAEVSPSPDFTLSLFLHGWWRH